MSLPSIPAGLSADPWPPMLAVRGTSVYGTFHAHHAMHFVLAVDGELRIRTSRRGRWTTAAGMLTAPDVPHAIDASGLEAVIVFFDPETDVGATLRTALRAPVRLISEAERTELIRGIDSPESFARADAREWLRQAATVLGLRLQESSAVLHPIVRELLARLRQAGLESDTSLAGLADSVGLSSGRLMHVFTESVGIPLRPYLAWLRVQRSACAILRGASVTDAAQLAGFADAAHMSRTFKRMLGFPPSVVRGMRSSER